MQARTRACVRVPVRSRPCRDGRTDLDVGPAAAAVAVLARPAGEVLDVALVAVVLPERERLLVT